MRTGTSTTTVGGTATGSPSLTTSRHTLTGLLSAHRDGGTAAFVAAGDEVRRLTYADAWARATHTAAMLVDAGVPQGRPVLVITDDPFALVVGFFGALLAGAHPVPVPDPGLGHPRNRTRVLAVVDACAPAAVVAPPRRVDAVTALLTRDGRPVPVLPTDEDAVSPREPARTPGVEEYWQFTSGTSRAPRHVAVRAEQAVAHLEQAAHVYDETPDAVSVNWVPLHHDMGLVTSVLRPLHSGYDSVLVPPHRFVADPATWLRAITEHRGTHTSSPDFGYALCTRKVASSEGLDLSGLRVARVAGELVRAATLDAFADRFAPAGFRRTAFAPSYGLAEAVLTVTTCGVDDAPRTLHVERAALTRDVVSDAAPGTAGLAVVSCGAPLPGTTVTVVTPDGRPAPDDAVGEVHVAGPQVVLEPTPVDVRGVAGRLTGDFGFVRDGELYLLGRSQERFQVNGENHYTAEVEAVVQDAAPHLRPGRVRAVPLAADDHRGPGLAVIGELRPEPATRAPEATTATARAVVGAVSRHFGLTVHVVHLVEPGALPLTSSGKLRRDALDTSPEGSIHTYHREGAHA